MESLEIEEKIDRLLRAGDLSLALGLARERCNVDDDARSWLLYAQILSLLDESSADNVMMDLFTARRRDPNVFNLFSQYLAYRGRFDDSRSVALQAFDLPVRMPMMISQLVISHMLCPKSDNYDNLSGMKRVVEKNCGAVLGGFNHVPKKPRYVVGFVSAALYSHPMSFFIESVLRFLDRKLFMVVVFSSSLKVDEYTVALSKLVDVWYDVHDLSDVQLIELVRAEKIDVLVDLDNHTEGNRLAVFSARCAPVQVSLYALNFSTGLKEMDYRFSDFGVDPLGAEDAYCEKLIRVKGSHIGYSPLDYRRQVGCSPWRKNGFITLGSFNSSVKINKRLFFVWMEILRCTGDGLLKIYGVDKAIQLAQFREWIRESGIDEARVIVLPRISVPELLGAMQSVDIALDTWPYGGGVTSAMTLSAGIPILTVDGDRAVSRVTASFLRHLNLDGWIAASPEDLVQVFRDRYERDNLDEVRLRIQDDFFRAFVESRSHVEGFARGLLAAIKIAKERRSPEAITVD